MNTRALTFILALCLAATLRAEIRTERIEYKHGDLTLEGFLAYDDAVTAPAPGVLVCHEWWGRSEHADNMARKLASLGYVAFALDMYGKGNITTTAQQASQWSGELYKDNDRLRERAALGLAVLATHARTDPKRLAVTGYCMGGTVALELARSGKPHTENLRAVVCFHTSTIAARNPDDNKDIKGTVLICHGQDDDFVKPEQITGFHAQMKDAGVDYVFVSYAGAVHSFTNPKAGAAGLPGVAYDEKADRRSWSHMASLFQEKFTD